MSKSILYPSALLLGILVGCGGAPKLKLHDWQKLPREQYTIPPFAKFLADFKIALDPGHGGMSHLPGYKRGPTGKRESIMNMNVARFLQEFLEKTGAEVVLTRTTDDFVSLQERADIAERNHCDFLISLHHNAASNPQVNYGAVFYHRHPDYSPLSLDLARNIYFGIVEAMRLPQVANEGLLTDQLIYPAGFGLLRRLTIPGVLLESSFYSNHREEERLMDLRYNRREAYGIFLGLARWAAGGLPSARLLSPKNPSRSKEPEIAYQLFDGITSRGGRSANQLLIYSNSVNLSVDDQIVDADLDMKNHRLSYQPAAPLANGSHRLQIQVQNMFKNHNLPIIDTLIVAAPVRHISFKTPYDQIPASPDAVIPISIWFQDADNEAAWDGTAVELIANRGRVFFEEHDLTMGMLQAYYQSSEKPGAVKIVASANDFRDSLALEIVSPGRLWLLTGFIRNDSTKAALADAEIRLSDTISARTDRNGFFHILNPPAGDHEIQVSASGYGSKSKLMQIDTFSSHHLNFALHANLNGLLHNEEIIIDAALDGNATDEVRHDRSATAAANLRLAKLLADRLRWAGSHPTLIREDDRSISTQERIKRINEQARGWYLRVNYRYWNRDSVSIRCTIYPANKVAERIARSICDSFAKHKKIGTRIEQNTSIPEVTLTNKTALEVEITCREPQSVERDLPALFDGIVLFKQRDQRSNKSISIREE